MENLSEQQLNELTKQLPPESISQHPTKPISSIKAIYVVERLNKVFGIGGWFVKNEIIERINQNKTSKTGTVRNLEVVVAKAILTVPKYGIEIEAYGGNDNEDLGDAYKGACTDALTKIGSYLGIGIDVFKGIQTPTTTTKPTTRPYIAPQETKLTDADDPLKTFSGREVTYVPKNTLCAGCGNPFIPKTPTATKCLDCWKKDNPR